MENNDVIVVKMGGIASDNLDKAFFSQLKQWQAENKKIVIVHGGGHYISKMMTLMNLKVEVKEGLRITSKKTLEITRMVLLGQVQPLITTSLQKAGLQPVGLNAGCNQLIQGDFINRKKLGYVGEVTQISNALLETLFHTDQIPVIAPLGITPQGQWLNINADEVACQVAASLQAKKLFLLTDVPGIKKDDVWLDEVCFEQLEQFVTQKIVTGGMVPKITSAKKALVAGVQSVCINNTITNCGTTILAKVPVLATN
ncbi:acetylglutamate kinase [Enterococcus canintestini]|uniref:acetylglutamate kinase n=1 Tax=Enterococcus canintestini TaxID=317010 RepID=UPI0028916B17|nr:acetylglutamate kinase [Enterococcus canintestini]MDT2740241.1 acetylglutamate kinase [Enterococcus canintestini]